MRVGELDDSVGKEFTSRRNEIAAEALRLPARLAEPVPGATRPAVPLLDSVHISPEARAVQFGRSPGSVPVAGLPLPGEVVLILQVIQAAPDSASAAAGLQRLAALVAEANGLLPPGALPTNQAIDPRAAAIVAALRAHSGASKPQAVEVALLIRELLESLPPSPAHTLVFGGPSRFELAAVAILLASVDGGEVYSLRGSARPNELPPALLSMLGPGSRQPIRRKGARRKANERDPEPDHEEPAGEASEQIYRAVPRRT